MQVERSVTARRISSLQIKDLTTNSVSQNDDFLPEILPQRMNIPFKQNQSQGSNPQDFKFMLERDKFIHGATIVLRANNYSVRRIIEVIQNLAERQITENTVRLVCEYWKKFKRIYFTTSSKSCTYTKQEAQILYQQLQNNNQSEVQEEEKEQKIDIIPYLKSILSKYSMTKTMLLQFSSFEEVKGIQYDQSYSQIKQIIESNKNSNQAEWIDVTVKLMISTHQFENNSNIEAQCLNKLKEFISFKSIKFLDAVKGEIFNGRGKFVYLHCRYDDSQIKKKKYLKKFFREKIPNHFYSRNCLNSQKLLILEYGKYLKKLTQQRLCKQQEDDTNDNNDEDDDEIVCQDE